MITSAPTRAFHVMRLPWAAVVVACCAGGCDSGQPVTVRNGDSVALRVHIRTSDGSVDWQRTLPPGTSASFRAHPTTDAVLHTSVIVDGVVVQERTKGYVTPSVKLPTCIAVSRARIELPGCEPGSGVP